MLGRREEEVEREEVERQLREVELQERMTVEAEEQDRVARTTELGEPEEGRDLDEDVPDADDEGEEEEAYESEEGDGIEGEEGEEDGLAVDLDDDIPEADELETEDENEPLSPAGADGGWVYDTRREPDTDDEDQLSALLPSAQVRTRGHARHTHVAGVNFPVPASENGYDERDAEDLADSMLGEDDLFAHETRVSARDLDDDVPDADDQAWEHTDTELEESEMDISLLPGQPQHGRSSGLGITHAQQPRRSSARTTATGPRSSGPWIAEPSPRPTPPSPPTHQAHVPQAYPQFLPRHRGVQAVTPSLASSSNLRSTSTRAARIVSGNRQRPYRPDRIHLPPPLRPHQLQQAQTPDMIDTPPLAAAAEMEIDLDVDVGEEADEDLEETETDVDDEINVDTPDPFIAPEFARAHGIARQNRETGRAGRVAPTAAIATRAGPGETTRTGRGLPSPTRTTRNWLDGAAAAIGVGANRTDVGNTAGTGPRRTLFQRATRRRNLNPEADTLGQAAQTQTAANDSGSGTGTASDGLFSSPPLVTANLGLTTIENEALAEWDTPEGSGVGQSQEHVGGSGRRRSGRFLGRRRGPE